MKGELEAERFELITIVHGVENLIGTISERNEIVAIIMLYFYIGIKMYMHFCILYLDIKFYFKWVDKDK